uniref:2Fe-2S ferredoxin n=1 Tax=uncultured bacterium 246 TaxID=698384 RepID=E3T6F2_9BACT|nr:2Fe-2S ferredoxin [uncultured bacterium 246]
MLAAKRNADYRITLVTPAGEHTIQVRPDEYIWDAANKAGITLPAMCHQGRCLTCAARMDTSRPITTGTPGAADFDQSVADAYLPADREAGFVLLCTAKPRSDLRLLTHQQDKMRAYRVSRGLPAPYA